MVARASLLLVMMSLLFASGQALGSITSGAGGFPAAYPGCAPPPSSTGQVHYVDPVHGSPLGNGSRQQPWRTLSEVIAAGLFATMPTHYDPTLKVWVHANPNAPIKPGDTVYLMNGNHGIVTIQGWLGKGGLAGYNNSQFITIAAYPGQTPVIDQLAIIGGNNWVFRGLTIQSNNTTNKYIASYNGVTQDYWLASLQGPHDNIIVEDNTFESQANVSGWTIQNWISKRASGLRDVDGRCVSITGNTFRNVGIGILTQSSNYVLVAGNTIDHFSDDGIDYGSNNSLIEYNTITNSVEDGDGVHRDGMQGQPYVEATVLSNVTITHNAVIRITDPTLRYPAQLQGIDEFDGVWNNVAVTDNVVITDIWNGIAYWGVHNAILSGNIVLQDSGKVLPCAGLQLAGCMAKSVIYDTSEIPLVVVNEAKNKSPSSHVNVTSNITTGIGIDPTTIAPLLVWGNMCVTTNGKCTMGIPANGKEVWYGKPGTYPGNNVITSVGAGGLFMTYDPVHMIYNLALRPGVR